MNLGAGSPDTEMVKYLSKILFISQAVSSIQTGSKNYSDEIKKIKKDFKKWNIFGFSAYNII